MDFLPIEIRQYVEAVTTQENDLLKEVSRDTHLHVINPRMLSGHFQGRLLSLFSHMIQPNRILEIGTFTGYGTLCLAEGLTENGQIVTIDVNEELAERARNNFDRSPYKSKIIFKIGPAVVLIPALIDIWDLVFIDADKENYLKYFDLIIDQLRPGGYIIADNVLWNGKVIEEKESDKKTNALKAFNKTIHDDSRIENLLLPISDGLMLMRKK